MLKRSFKWGCGGFLGLVVIVAILQTLNIIDTPEEIAATETAEAIALIPTNTSTITPTDGPSPIPTDTPTITPTPTVTDTPIPLVEPTITVTPTTLTDTLKITVPTTQANEHETSGMIESTDYLEPHLIAASHGLNLVPYALIFTEEVGSEHSDSDLYLIVYGDLVNYSDDEQCVFAHDLRLHLNSDTYAPQNGDMDTVKKVLFNDTDFIGAYSGQCVQAGNVDPTFFVFEVPAGDANSVRIVFEEADVDLTDLSWPTTTRTEVIIFSNDQIEEEVAGNNIVELAALLQENHISNDLVVSDAGSTQIPSATPSPTSIPRTPISISSPEPLPLPTSTPQPDIYYSTTNANVRSCPQTLCDVVFVINAGERFEAIDTADGDTFRGSTMWLVGEYNGQTVYLHSELAVDNLAELSPTSAPLPVSAPTQAGATRIPRPGNCSTAVAMGLSAQQAAQWPHLDRDNDGVACYGD